MRIGSPMLGIEPGDRVAILAATRPEWTLADCGALCAGAVVVPIYHTNSPGGVRVRARPRRAARVICEDAEQLAKIEQVRGALPALEHVVAFDGAGGRASCRSTPARRAARRRRRAAERVARVDAGRPGDDRLHVGHDRARRRAACSRTQLHGDDGDVRARARPGSDEPSIFLFLPLAHVLARITQMVTLDVGGTLAFWGGDPKRLLEDIARRGRRTSRRSRGSSRRSTRRRSAARGAGGAQAGALRLGARTGAGARGRARRDASARCCAPSTRSPTGSCSSKVRGLFGGRLELALTGAAPIGREVLEFFDACGVLVLEGYGMTETCAAATLNTPDAVPLRHRRPAAAGHRGRDRRRRRDPDARPARVRRLLPRPRGDRGDDRSTTAGCAPATSARSTRTASCASPAARRT